MLSFKLLGNVELSKNGALLQGFRSQKEPALLIYLAQTGGSYRRDFVADLLWDSHSTKQALSNLRTVLTRLQKQVGDALVCTQRSLAVAPEIRQQVDSVMLLRMLAGTGELTSADQAVALQKALDTYRGDFLADFHLRNAPHFDAWATATREYIRRDVISAYDKLGQYALSTGDSEWGIVVARRWLQVDALDETAHTLLIRLLIAGGNMRDAIAHYDDCVALLHTELGAAPPAAMTALIKDVRPAHTIRSFPDATVPHNLPATYDQFFGRRIAQHELHDRLNQPWCRLVTIIGPGGVGKTRLATTIARSRLSHYRDGVWLVELANLDAQDDNLAEAIAVEIATALDLRFSGSAQPIEQLLNYLQYKQMLLLLDNVEHLLEGMQLVLDIVQRCDHVQLLVTSREPLQLRAEWTIALSGLSYPSSEADETPAEAVELFAARRAQQQWQAICDDDLVAIRTICQLVEGLPLAIELAAALTRSATPQAIADRLRHGFDALTTSLRDVPQRHRSLQVVFEMSWSTLTSAFQQRLARLSVFRGGFSTLAAQQIAETNVQQLAALGEKSLVSHNDAFDRYRLHPVIRAYAAEKLPASAQTQHKHAQYYLTLLAQQTEPLQKNNPQDGITMLEPDIDNLRLAWQMGLALRHADWLTAALTSLSIYYQLRGLAQEGEAVMHMTVTSATAWAAEGIGLATRAGLEQARFQNRIGRYWTAILTSKAALKLASQSADRWAEGMAHVLWGEALWRMGEYDSARNKLSYAFAIAQTIDSMLIIGWCHHHLGVIDDIQTRYGAAHDHLQHACDAWRALDNATTLSNSLNSIGLVCSHQGDLPAAQQAMEQALALCTHVDNRHMQALLLNNLSTIATEQGDYAGAQNYLQRGLALAIASGNATGQAEIHTNFGRNALLLGDVDGAVAMLERGLQLSEMLGNRSLMATTMLNLAESKQAQGDLQSAVSLYNQALHIAQQDKLQRTECNVLIGLAKVLSDTNPRQARQCSAEAVALAEAIGNAQLLERATTIAYTLHLSTDTTKQNLSA